jgi:hypothetical protein
MERLDAGEGETITVNTGRLQAVAKAAKEAGEYPAPFKPQPKKAAPSANKPKGQ